MRLFERTLDTVLEADTATSPNGALPVNQNSPTMTYSPQQSPNQQMVDAVRTREQLQANQLANMPIDQKIELALKKSAEAEKIAYRTLRDISAVDKKLDKAFKDLTTLIQKGPGKTAPEPPGESIWDEGDSESIFGR